MAVDNHQLQVWVTALVDAIAVVVLQYLTQESDENEGSSQTL